MAPSSQSLLLPLNTDRHTTSKRSNAQQNGQIMQDCKTRHLLSLPLELRRMVYNTIVDMAAERRLKNWYDKPRPEFSALMVVCRQLYHEIRTFRPQILVPYDNFRKFHASLVKDCQLNAPLNRYRSLSIQFSLNASARSFEQLARTLYALRNTLEELNLSFTDVDSYGTPVRLHGCAYDELSGREKKLPLDGQRKQEMLSVCTALLYLKQLRVLVLSNLNAELFRPIFMHKPKLEYVHVTADPRSAVHNNFTLTELGPLLTMQLRYPPPVKVMNIPANAMKNAFALPSMCATTLEHFTWTIPDASLGSNMIGADIYSNTLQLVNNLALNFTKLKTLRICVQGDGLYGHVQNYTNLERAITGAITSLTNLKDYEVHLASRSRYMGYNMLLSLPRGLKRFYTTSQLVAPREIHRFVTEQYLSATIAPTQLQPPHPHDVRFPGWCPRHPQPPLPYDHYPEYCVDKQRCETIEICLNSSTNEFTYDKDNIEEDNSVVDQTITRSWEKRAAKGPYSRALYRSGIIGEDLRRKDYIPLRTGDLKFISYEFNNPEDICPTGGTGETLTQMMLRINGRLLDRERNKHLARLAPCEYIRPTISPAHNIHTGHQEELDKQFGNIVMNDMLEVKATNQERTQLFLEELAASPFTDDERYFGRENEAWSMFHKEEAARPEKLLPLTYPYYVDEDHGDEDRDCCWMCPDPYVPTLAEMDKMRAQRRRSTT